MAEKVGVGCGGPWGSKRRQEGRDPFRSRDQDGPPRDLGVNNQKVIGYPEWRVPEGTGAMEVRGGDTPTNGRLCAPESPYVGTVVLRTITSVSIGAGTALARRGQCPKRAAH